MRLSGEDEGFGVQQSAKYLLTYEAPVGRCPLDCPMSCCTAVSVVLDLTGTPLAHWSSGVVPVGSPLLTSRRPGRYQRGQDEKHCLQQVFFYHYIVGSAVVQSRFCPPRELLFTEGAGANILIN